MRSDRVSSLRWGWGAAVLALTAIVAVAASPIAGAQAPATPQAAPAASPPQATAQPPAPAAFASAVSSAARTLLKALPARADKAPIEVVIDPLVDGATGLHTQAAGQMGRLIVAIARTEFPNVRIVELDAASLARKPILLIGTITALQQAGQAAPAPRPYAIWLTAADTASREIVAKARATALPQGVDPRPVASHGDGPAWRKDAAVQGYIDSCRKTKVGDKLDAAYSEQLTAAALVASAGQAYDTGKTQQALKLYREALAQPGGRQVRVLNGIYASLTKLGRTKEADAAFGQIVDHGFDNKDLSLKLLFRAGTARFADGSLTRAYPSWLRQIAQKAAERKACLETVGHTSTTGPAAVNDQISQLRAEHVRNRLVEAQRDLDKRIIARGVGSREVLIGTGRDDASDALDRRVEFKVLGCS